jgi:hypothetical protein
LRRFLSPLVATAVVFFAAHASAVAPLTFVPWKVLRAGAEPVKGPLILVWIPSSADDFKRSDLLVSRPLALLPSQCVGLQVVRSDDAALIEKLGATGKLPLALLVASDWSVVARSVNDHGELRAAEVEKMVYDELRAREEALEKQLDDAAKKEDAGDRDAAVALYRAISRQRCAFPRCAREASRALHRMGVKESPES